MSKVRGMANNVVRRQISLNRLHFALRGWILAAALIFLLAARAASHAPLRPAWLLLLLAGIALRTWAGAHLGGHGNAPRAQAPELATGGPYRFSRNPLYLANLLVATGLILYANALPAFVAVLLILAVLFHHAILVRHEEAVLARMFGEAYEAYRRHVSRWIGIARKARKGNPERGGGGASLRETVVRQGRNAGYALLAALSVWIASRWS